MTHYRRMSPQQAQAALEEFLAERAPALEGLHEELLAHGIDSETMLDTTPGSLSGLWGWITGRQAELAAGPGTDAGVPPRSVWPSWARHTLTGLKIPSATMFVLLDGLVSYLAQVLITGAPTSVWALGSPEDPGHHLHHHPVLIGSGHQIFVPILPMGGMLRLKRAEKSLGEHELADYATATIAALNEGTPYLPVHADPPVVVTTTAEALDVGVRADIATGHPGLVAQMATALTTQQGINAVERFGHDALEVHAAGWEADALQWWLASWLRIRLPFDR